MRPIRLRIQGFRSFTDERLVDFSDLTLFAVIGATGAGKSSILEAICYALYGVATSEKDLDPKDLLCTGSDSMAVSLTFRADGDEYIVTRAYAVGRRLTPTLECPARPEKNCDGRISVDASIRALLGVEHQTFVSAVIVPQGRFSEVLHATETKRASILRELLGLERVERMRGRLEEPRSAGASALARLRGSL